THTGPVHTTTITLHPIKTHTQHRKPTQHPITLSIKITQTQLTHTYSKHYAQNQHHLPNTPNTHTHTHTQTHTHTHTHSAAVLKGLAPLVMATSEGLHAAFQT